MSSFFDSTIFNCDMTVFFTLCRDIFNFGNTSFRNFFVKTLWSWMMTFMMFSIHIKTSLIVIRYSMSVSLFRKCINVYYCIIIPLLGFCVIGEGGFFLVKLSTKRVQ